jgi:hypothetical protein
MNRPGVRSSERRLPSILACFIAFAVLAVASPEVARAAGGNSEQARAQFDKASASFALGHYAEAAESFEKAFELRPDSALLYNAAQAHRLAGEEPRALILYQNYLRLYPKAPMRPEAEARVDELKKAIERDRAAATTPPAATSSAAEPKTAATVTETGRTTPGPSAPAAPVVNLRPPVPGSSPPPSLVTQSQPERSQPLTSKPLFWATVAGGVAVVAAVVVVVALGGAKDPLASLGVVK